jgi:hypothetical protein
MLTSEVCVKVATLLGKGQKHGEWLVVQLGKHGNDEQVAVKAHVMRKACLIFV